MWRKRMQKKTCSLKLTEDVIRYLDNIANNYSVSRSVALETLLTELMNSYPTDSYDNTFTNIVIPDGRKKRD